MLIKITTLTVISGGITLRKKAIVEISFLLLLIGFGGLFIKRALVNQVSDANKTNFDASKVVRYMSKHGIIEHPSKWQRMVANTKNGKNIKTVPELSRALQQGNDHAWAVSSLKKIENLNYPTITETRHLKILNVPSFYSNSAQKRAKYINTLSHQLGLLQHQETLILNFSNNLGGDPLPMIAGLADLIPRGTLWADVDNKGHEHNVIKGRTAIYGGLTKTTEKVPSPHKKLNFKKIVVVSNQRTASAAEVTLIALKRNKHTKIIGRPTTGLTSINRTIKIGPNSAAAVITVGTIDSPVPIHGQTHFNNDPIIPDRTTLYPPISPTKGADYIDQQPFDPDFVDELLRYIH